MAQARRLLHQPALQSEDEFLVGVKKGQLNGPTTYNLGHPVVSSLTATSAMVTGCIYDTGTTTALVSRSGHTRTGALEREAVLGISSSADGSWKITAFKTTSVSKC